MKVILKTLVFLSFALIALFGFAAMGDSIGHCIVSAMQGTVCPTNSLGSFASFHLGFFKNFSSAAFETLAAAAVLFALALLTIVSTILTSLEIPSSAAKEIEETGGLLPVRKTRRWLSLLETSPTFSLR